MEVWLLSLEMCHKGALVSILMPVSTIMHLERSAEPKKKKKSAFCKGILLHTVSVADERSLYSSEKINK